MTIYSGSLHLQMLTERGHSTEQVEARNRKMFWEQVYKESQHEHISTCVHIKISGNRSHTVVFL